MYVKEGTSTDGLIRVGSSSFGGSDLVSSGVTATSSWVEKTYEFIATTTTSHVSLWVQNSANQTVLYDTVTVKPIGAVVALLPNNVLESGDWQDASPNLLNGTGTGTTALIPNRATYEREAIDDRCLGKAVSPGVAFTGGGQWIITPDISANDQVTCHYVVEIKDEPSTHLNLGGICNGPGSGGGSGVAFASLESNRDLTIWTTMGTPGVWGGNAQLDDVAKLELNKIYVISVTSDKAGGTGLTAYINGKKVGNTAITGEVGYINTPKLNLANNSVVTCDWVHYGATVFNRVQTESEISNFAKRLVVEPADKWGSALEYVTNGAFASDSNWTKGSGWTIGSGVASATSSSAALSQTQSSVIENGQKFRLTYTVSNYSAGSLVPSLGSDTGSSVSANGTYTEVFTATGASPLLSLTGTSLTADIDDVSLVRVGAVVALLPTPGSIESDGTWLDSSSNAYNGVATSVAPLITQPSQRGTFTPTLSFVGNSAGITYSEQLGTWERVGERAIAITGRITLTSKGTHGASSAAEIEGLPFTSRNANDSSLLTMAGVNFSSLASAVVGQVKANSTAIKVLHYGATGDFSLDWDNFTDTTVLLFSGTYLIP